MQFERRERLRRRLAEHEAVTAEGMPQVGQIVVEESVPVQVGNCQSRGAAYCRTSPPKVDMNHFVKTLATLINEQPSLLASSGVDFTDLTACTAGHLGLPG